MHDTQTKITQQEKVFHPEIIVLLDLLFLNYEQFLIYLGTQQKCSLMKSYNKVS